MTDFRIRDARPGDQDQIREVTLAAYGQYATIMPSPHWEEYRESILVTLDDPSPAEQIVAELKGKIVGTVLLLPLGTEFPLPNGETAKLGAPEVRLLATAPEARGQGIGRALMEECIARARQVHAPRITLHTTDMMQVGMRLYERMGFVRNPDLDFRPAEGIVVKGYRYELEDGTGGPGDKGTR